MIIHGEKEFILHFKKNLIKADIGHCSCSDRIYADMDCLLFDSPNFGYNNAFLIEIRRSDETGSNFIIAFIEKGNEIQICQYALLKICFDKSLSEKIVVIHLSDCQKTVSEIVSKLYSITRKKPDIKTILCSVRSHFYKDINPYLSDPIISGDFYIQETDKRGYIRSDIAQQGLDLCAKIISIIHSGNKNVSYKVYGHRSYDEALNALLSIDNIKNCPNTDIGQFIVEILNVIKPYESYLRYRKGDPERISSYEKIATAYVIGYKREFDPAFKSHIDAISFIDDIENIIKRHFPNSFEIFKKIIRQHL